MIKCIGPLDFHKTDLKGLEMERTKNKQRPPKYLTIALELTKQVTEHNWNNKPSRLPTLMNRSYRKNANLY